MAVYKSKKSTKDGRSYFFRIKYKDILGTTHDYTSPKYKTLREAKEQEALYRVDTQQQKTNFSNITIKDAYTEWFNKHKAEVKLQTSIHYKDLSKYLDSIFKININSFNLAHYNNFYNYISKLSISTTRKNKILGLLRNIIKYSNKYYNTSDSILKYIDNFKNPNEMKKEMNFYTYEEYKKFESVIDELNWKTLFQVLYFMGLRIGECQALTWEDIDFNKKTLSVSKTLTNKIKGKEWVISTPKTKNSTRVLPIPENVLNSLKTMNNEAKKYTNYTDDWFVFGNAIPFKSNTIQNHNIKYEKLANLKHIRIHDFRHSCASLLINKGASITLVSKYLGHSKVSITLDVYSHFYKSELLDITNLISNL